MATTTKTYTRKELENFLAKEFGKDTSEYRAAWGKYQEVQPGKWQEKT